MNRLFHNVADACANAVPDTDMYWIYVLTLACS